MTKEKEPEASPPQEKEPQQPQEEEVALPVLKNLFILPPLQKNGTANNRDEVLDRVPLPQIRAEEPVASIRAALGEVFGYSHLTNYRFELVESPVKTPAIANNTTPIISPYTGRDAVVAVPSVLKSLEDEKTITESSAPPVLDDYGDLSPLLEQGLQDGSAFRIVLERYDVAQIRDHINRLRSLLDGNAPSTSTLDDGAGADAVAEEKNPPEGEDAEKKTDNNKETKEASNKDQKADEEENKIGLPSYPPGKAVALDCSALNDFYYLACGEDPSLYSRDESKVLSVKQENGTKKKKGKKGKGNVQKMEEEKEESKGEQAIGEIIPQLNQLEEQTRVKCSIKLSGFHPPQRSRRLMGDLVYLEVIPPGQTEPIFITAIASGFYVNRSKLSGGQVKFDPSPAAKPCFSHELLDCLLQASNPFLDAWKEALVASKSRASLMLKLNADGHFASLFRVAIRGDFKGYKSPSTGSAADGIDALVQTPSWLVPLSRAEAEAEEGWNKNAMHSYNYARTEDDLGNSFGVDVRNGTTRDWNEELQTAREMPDLSLFERVERARVMNKVLTDFGEASLLGIKAIFDGHIAPMNPNEPARTQVYLHNNIFFSRAIDAGIETFKIAKGDKAARKSASRDVACLGALHRMEKAGLYTLATVLIDYLGSRFVCQSILPGILSGEKSHTLLYGTVEAGFPLTWDKEMHDLLEESLGKLWIANRTVPRLPLTDERIAAINESRVASPLFRNKDEEEKKEDKDSGPTVEISGPVEAKGIKGSDQRKYVLDMTRLTPRDANWVEEGKGGTGYWEALGRNGPSTKSQARIPKKLDDDEWTLAVLRPELVQSYAQFLIAKHLQEKAEKKKQEAEKEATERAKEKDGKTDDKAGGDKKDGEDSKEKADEPTISEEDMKYIKSLRMNVNVFLPDIKSLEGIDDDAFAQVKKDEDLVRDAAKFLWDQIIPRLTYQIRMGSASQLPHGGKSLTEFLHNNGINCRYLSRLATLAQAEEKKDRDEADRRKQGKALALNTKSFPLFWLELLECEMVARAAKHVLDRYLTENGGTAALFPMQTVASFLCALLSSGDETAAQTENRMGKRSSGEPDEDDFNALTYFDDGTGGETATVSIRSRAEVWNDLEQEIGRRYRYILTIFNRPANSSRALYLPLLRRVCQRTGVRLAAKPYEVGGRCMCGGSGQISPSYPISPLDIIDIVPLMKHSAAHGGGFSPCSAGNASTGLPALHISLPDARTTLEAAHRHRTAKALPRALDLAQEACSLYQRVAETPAHPGVVSCIDLIADILLEAGETPSAASNLSKSLGLLVQVKGFDASDSIHVHLVLFQMYLKGGKVNESIKHIRAAIFLMELMSGPRHPEIANAYHRLGTVYHGNDEPKIALQMYEEAYARGPNDRIAEATILESIALAYSAHGDFKTALDKKKAAFHLFNRTVGCGEDHPLTKRCDAELNKLMSAAVKQGSRMVKDLRNQKEEEAADAIANQLEAEEAASAGKKKKKNKKKKGNK